ncbi:MafB family polymorphic toxin, partial [Neisseria meningitidis]
QDSAFAVKDGINSARQWADAHPNITATAQTALAVAEAAGTVWRGKKVELNPTKWDWVKNNGYKTPAARPMQTLDGEMAGGNKPVVKSIRPTTRDELRQALQEQGFRRTGSDEAQYETWKGPDGVKIDIRPNGEVIRTQRVPRTDGVQGKYPQRQNYEGNPLPNNRHHSGYFIK